MRQRVSKWYKYWLDVLETHIVYFRDFHGVWTGNKLCSGPACRRLAAAHNCGPVQLTSQAATQLRAGPPDLAGRPGNLPIVPTATPPLVSGMSSYHDYDQICSILRRAGIVTPCAQREI